MQALYKISYVNKLLCIWIYSYILYNILFAFFLVASLSLRKRDRDSGKQENILIGNEASTQPLLSLGLLNHFFCSSVQRPFQIDHFPSDYFASYIRACICKKKFTIISVIYSLFEEFATYYKESVGRNLEETRARNIFISYFLVEQFNVPAKSFTLHCSSVLLVLCNVLSLAYFRDGYL